MVRLHGTRPFEALESATRLLKSAGFSAGSGCAGQPTAIMFGDYMVAKWKNLTWAEREAVHGVMTGDRRNGPLAIELRPCCPPEGREAFIVAASDLEGVA